MTTDSAIKNRLQEDMKLAMKSKDNVKLGIIRFILAAVKRYEIDNKTLADDVQVIIAIDKLIKQQNDAVAQYKQANRTDLVQKEQNEITILQSYLPPPLTEEEINVLIQEAFSVTKAASMRDMGKVMNFLKEKTLGRADIGMLSAKVKAMLADK